MSDHPLSPADCQISRLDDRRIIEIGGADRATFLQGLISNDIEHLSATTAIYAALLTPQGKYLADFVILDTGAAFLLDVPAGRADTLLQKLTLYRLRAQVTIAPRDDLSVAAIFGPDALTADGLDGTPGKTVSREGGQHLIDPRLAALGARVVGDDAAMASLAHCFGEPGPASAYHAHRLALGVPEGEVDLVPDKSLLLESGFVELHGVSFEKGCFVGQELTARMRYRATVRKRLLPVAIEGEAPAPGTPNLAGDKEIGELRSTEGDRGVALIRLDRWADARSAGTSLQADAATLVPSVPDWMDLTVGADAKASAASA